MEHRLQNNEFLTSFYVFLTAIALSFDAVVTFVTINDRSPPNLSKQTHEIELLAWRLIA